MTAIDGATSTGRAMKEGQKQQQEEPATAEEKQTGGTEGTAGLRLITCDSANEPARK